MFRDSFEEDLIKVTASGTIVPIVNCLSVCRFVESLSEPVIVVSKGDCFFC